MTNRRLLTRISSFEFDSSFWFRASHFVMPLAAVIFSLFSMAGLWLAVGNSLGLWFGAFGVVAILLPAMSMRRKTISQRVIDAAAVVDCVAAVLLVATLAGEVTIFQWLRCALVLYAFAAAGFGTAAGLRACRVPMEFVVLTVTIGLLAWLAAPVWLSGWMNDSIASLLSKFHPLLAVNGRLASLGVWLEQGVVYGHTSLGQDIAYALPTTVWWTTGLHLAIGMIGGGVAMALRWGKRTG